MKAILITATLMLLAMSGGIASADQLFKCEDGTYTNIPERMCPAYEPQGTVLIMPTGATLASMKAMLGDTPSKSRIPDPPLVCNLYQEWLALNLKTGGGVTFAYTQDVPRWIALSRIFTAIGAPHCP